MCPRLHHYFFGHGGNFGAGAGGISGGLGRGSGGAGSGGGCGGLGVWEWLRSWGFKLRLDVFCLIPLQIVTSCENVNNYSKF